MASFNCHFCEPRGHEWQETHHYVPKTEHANHQASWDCTICPKISNIRGLTHRSYTWVVRRAIVEGSRLISTTWGSLTCTEISTHWHFCILPPRHCTPDRTHILQSQSDRLILLTVYIYQFQDTSSKPLVPTYAGHQRGKAFVLNKNH